MGWLESEEEGVVSIFVGLPEKEEGELWGSPSVGVETRVEANTFKSREM